MNYLVIIDMQKDFNPEQQVVSYIKDFITQNRNKYNLVMTMDNHIRTTYIDSQESKVYEPHCLYGTLGWEVVDELRPLVYDNEVRHVYKDTFGSIELMEYIRRNSAETTSVTLMGVCTDICVLSNAFLLRAAMPNMRIIVDAAGCNGTSPEMHKWALALMKANAIEVINEGV